MAKVKVALLGSTGIVGQVFVWILSRHELFDLVYISASESKCGKKYKDAVNWLLPYQLPIEIINHNINAIDYDKLKANGIKIIFSALPTEVAAVIEPKLKNLGFWVFTNASAMRYNNDVPILIPEINLKSISLIEKQGYPREGFVIANANCSVTGLSLALAPLMKFGITELYVSTYQSVSGAGYPGLSALDISGNVIPLIRGEEEKIILELRKILETNINVFPFCLRVPTLIGHLETVWIKFKMSVAEKDILETWQSFGSADIRTPSIPANPIIYTDSEDLPQTKMSFNGNPPGMPVYTGRLKDHNGRFGFVLLVNNLVRGAAGGSIANAEAFLSRYGNTL